MQAQPTRRSSLFLLELIIAILFFILASTVCVRLFAKSHVLEKESVEINHAVSSAVSIAEIFRNQEECLSFLQEHFPLGSKHSQGFSIHYDEHWVPCLSSEEIYVTKLNLEHNISFLIGHIDIYKGDRLLYSLTIKKYTPQEADT